MLFSISSNEEVRAIDLLKMTRFFLALASLLMFVIYINRLDPLVAFMDSMRYLTYFGNSIEGKSSIFATWNQGEHRGLLVQLGVYFNALILGLNVKAATYFSGICIFLTCILLTRHQLDFLDANQKQSKMNAFILMSITFLALFSFSNWELYSLDVGAFLFLKNLLFIFFWVSLSRVFEWGENNRIGMVALLCLLPFIMLVVAYGWIYAFAVATIAYCFLIGAVTGDAYRFRNKIFFLVVLSLIIYVVAGYFTPTDMGIPPAKKMDIANILKSIFYAVSSIFIGSETSEAIGITYFHRCLIVIPFLAGLIFLVVDNIRKKTPKALVPLTLIIYSFLQILAVSYARGKTDPTLAMAPRYYFDFVLLFIGFFWSFTGSNLSARVSRGITIVVYIFVTLFATGQILTCIDEMRKAPYRHDSFIKMKDATIKANITLEQAQLLQQPIGMAVRGVNVQRKYALGPYRSISCGNPFFLDNHYNDGWIGKETTVLVRNCGEELSLSMYIPATFLAKQVQLSVAGFDDVRLSLTPGMLTTHSWKVANYGQIIALKIVVDKTDRPSDLNINSADMRDLGLMISGISVSDVQY